MANPHTSLFVLNAGGGFYYDLIYLLTFILLLAGLLWIGRKQGFDPTSWILALAASRFFFILGTKIFTYDAGEWTKLLTGFNFSPTNDKTLLGGMALSLLSFFLLKKPLNLSGRTLDAFALIMPLGIALQRVGCFLAGCCYGNTTTVPWSVRYLPGTLAHYHQVEAGLIPAGAPYSLPVHPYQLYEALGGLTVAGLLFIFRRRIKVPGNTFLLSLLLYGAIRFFLEYLRNPLAHAAGGLQWEGLKVAQWTLLIAVPVLAGILIYRENKGNPTPWVSTPPSLAAALLVLLPLVILTWELRQWLTYTELLALNMTLYPAIGVVALFIFRNIFIPSFRWLAFASLLLPLFLMSQTLPQTLNQPEDSSQTSTYHSVKVGFGSGNFQNSHNVGQGSGCERVSHTAHYQQKYTLGGGGYAISKIKGQGTFTYGLNAYLGRHQEIQTYLDGLPVSNAKTRETNLFGLHPFVLYEQRWAGLGGGLHLGNLVYTLENQEKDGSGNPESGSLKTPVYPQVYLRVGPADILFGEFRLADQLPSGLPGLRYQVSLGSGLGLKNGTFLRFGTNGIASLISARMVLNKYLVVEPLYLWGQEDYPAPGQPKQFSLGLQYRFKHKN